VSKVEEMMMGNPLGIEMGGVILVRLGRGECRLVIVVVVVLGAGFDLVNTGAKTSLVTKAESKLVVVWRIVYSISNWTRIRFSVREDAQSLILLWRNCSIVRGALRVVSPLYPYPYYSWIASSCCLSKMILTPCREFVSHRSLQDKDSVERGNNDRILHVDDVATRLSETCDWRAN
jgi:hypothetical protein